MTIIEEIKSKLKVGDKLYARHYWSDGENEWETCTIKKINRTTVSLKSYDWKLPIIEIGTTYFTSKRELIEDCIEAHEEKLKEISEEEIEPIKKELQYLKKKFGGVKK